MVKTSFGSTPQYDEPILIGYWDGDVLYKIFKED